MKNFLRSALFAVNVALASATYGHWNTIQKTTEQLKETLSPSKIPHQNASEFLREITHDKKITSKELYKINKFIENPKNLDALKEALNTSSKENLILKDNLYKIFVSMVNTQEDYRQQLNPIKKWIDAKYNEKKRSFDMKYARQAYAIQLYAKLFPVECWCKLEDWIKVDGKFGNQTHEILENLRKNTQGKIDISQVLHVDGNTVELDSLQKKDIDLIEKELPSLLPLSAVITNPLRVGTRKNIDTTITQTDSSRIYETTIRTPVEDESNLKDLDAQIEVFEKNLKLFSKSLKDRKGKKVYDAVPSSADSTKISTFRFNPVKSQEYVREYLIDQANLGLDEIFSKTQWSELVKIAGTLVIEWADHDNKNHVKRQKRFLPDEQNNYHITLWYGFDQSNQLPKANYLLDIVLKSLVSEDGKTFEKFEVLYPSVEPLSDEFTAEDKKKYHHLTVPHYSLNNSSIASKGNSCKVDITKWITITKTWKLLEKFTYSK